MELNFRTKKAREKMITKMKMVKGLRTPNPEWDSSEA
jgi:hypothetical protein